MKVPKQENAVGKMMWRRHLQVMPRPEAENEHITNRREPWLSKQSCWDTVWHLSDPGKKVPSFLPCSSPGEFACLPCSLYARCWTVVPSGLIFLIFSSKLTSRPMVSWSESKQVSQRKSRTGFLVLAFFEWQRKDALRFLVLRWFLRSLEWRCSLFLKVPFFDI